MQTKVSLTFTNEIVFLHALQQFVYFAPFKILEGNTYDTRLYLYILKSKCFMFINKMIFMFVILFDYNSEEIHTEL